MMLEQKAIMTLEWQIRPKQSTRFGHGHAYTPAPLVAQGLTIKNIAFMVKSAWMKEHGRRWETTGAFAMEINNYRPIPKNASKAKRAMMTSGEICPITRPDRDNLEKPIQDACQGVFFDDDSQIVDGATRKLFDDGDGPRTVVTIWRRHE